LPITATYSIYIILYEGEPHDKALIANAVVCAVTAALSVKEKNRTMPNCKRDTLKGCKAKTLKHIHLHEEIMQF
jgi:hypothetical protein